jgi:hypothetical protein
VAVLLPTFPEGKLFLPSVGRSKSHQHQLIFIIFPKNHNFIKYHHYSKISNNKNETTKWQLGQIHTSGTKLQVEHLIVEQMLNHHLYNSLI